MVAFIYTIVLVIICLAFGYLRGERIAGKRAQAQIDRANANEDALKELSAALEQRWVDQCRELEGLRDALKTTLSQKKSSEVRTGLIAEQMAPFLEGFPYAPGKAIFLGKPLDFLVFDEEGIHFVEVKSGNAQLNSNQRKIRDQLKEKKVTFEVYRIKGSKSEATRTRVFLWAGGITRCTLRIGTQSHRIFSSP